MGTIYFISESLPLELHGSFVIFHCHLKRLEQSGYKIHLIIPYYDRIEEAEFYHEYLKTWEVTLVPFRKWWFAPYRYNKKWLRQIRYYSLFLPIRKKLMRSPPSYVVSYMHAQYLNGFACFLSHKFKCGLGFFLHDDKSLLTNDPSADLLKYDQDLVEKANIIWSVSKELIIEGTDRSKYRTLPPIPEGSTEEPLGWQSRFKKPVIGFAGSIYESYIPLFALMANVLKRYSGDLIIICKENDLIKELCLSHPNISNLHPFTNNREALEYIKGNCSAVFCGYPDDLRHMPWIRSCFPSKFVEFSHIHLPIILSSPKGTALSQWADENDWELYTDNYTLAGFSQLIEKLVVEHHWTRNRDQVVNVATTKFNPIRIQEDFSSSLHL